MGINMETEKYLDEDIDIFFYIRKKLSLNNNCNKKNDDNLRIIFIIDKYYYQM